MQTCCQTPALLVREYLYKGMQSTRPPFAASQDGEEELLQRIQALAPQYRTRPSALLPVVRATGAALGVLSAVLPRPLQRGHQGYAAQLPSLLALFKSCLCCEDMMKHPNALAASF